MANDTAGSTSVDKALALVLLLNEAEQLRVSEAADALGVARSTAHRLLNQLIARDFAVQDGRRVYRPGPALRALRSTPSAPPDLRRALHDHLLSCSRRVTETVHLMVLDGTGVRFVDGVEGPHTLRVGLRTGAVLPAHRTSGGKALLAALSTEDLRALYPNGLPPGGVDADDPPTLAALARALTQVRRRGFAINVNESELGISAIGCPVVDSVGRTVAAMAITAPSARYTRQRLTELAPVLVHAADEAGRQL